MECLSVIEFLHPQFLWLLLSLPVLLGWFIRRHRRRTREISRSFDPKAFHTLSQGGRGRKVRKQRFVTELLALALLIISASGPRVGTSIQELKREGVDIVVALDLSRSMLTQDVTPDRLTRAKLEVKKLINSLKGDRIGLVGFAGIAHLQCPLTLDHSAASMLLNVMDETLLPVQGTALADAIGIAVKAFPEDDEGRDRAIIVISDGEDHEKNVEDAARKASEAGITIYSLGVGTLKGGPVPVYDKNGQLSDYKRNSSNQVVTSRLEEADLSELASQTGGSYYRLYERKDPLARIYSDIQTLDKREYKTHDFSKYVELYQFFLILAILLLFPEFVISDLHDLLTHRRKVHAS